MGDEGNSSPSRGARERYSFRIAKVTAAKLRLWAAVNDVTISATLEAAIDNHIRRCSAIHGEDFMRRFEALLAATPEVQAEEFARDERIKAAARRDGDKAAPAGKGD